MNIFERVKEMSKYLVIVIAIYQTNRKSLYMVFFFIFTRVSVQLWELFRWQLKMSKKKENHSDFFPNGFYFIFFEKIKYMIGGKKSRWAELFLFFALHTMHIVSLCEKNFVRVMLVCKVLCGLRCVFVAHTSRGDYFLLQFFRHLFFCLCICGHRIVFVHVKLYVYVCFSLSQHNHNHGWNRIEHFVHFVVFNILQ